MDRGWWAIIYGVARVDLVTKPPLFKLLTQHLYLSERGVERERLREERKILRNSSLIVLAINHIPCFLLLCIKKKCDLQHLTIHCILFIRNNENASQRTICTKVLK